jgi:hypothetical protein
MFIWAGLLISKGSLRLLEINSFLLKMPNSHTDADCMSSVNQGPCWDSGDTLGWGKAQGKAETSAPWIPSPWKASPHHDTLKEQAGHHPHTTATRPPGHHPPTGPPAHQTSAQQTHWATTHRPAHQPTSRQLQACLGDLQQTKQKTFLLEPYLAKKKKKKK